MDLILILFWFGFSFLVGLMGSGKNITFFGAFFISLFLSPIIGLIVVLVSGKPQRNYQQTQFKYITYYNEAQRLENRGDIDEAIKTYKDVVFEIRSKTPPKNKIAFHNMKKYLEASEAKIEELNKMI